MKKDISKCNCKTGCKTSHCSYKKVSTKCSSQCHKGLKCKNYDKDRPYDKKNMSLSKWGGSCDFNKVKCVFVNTCPVDSWLVLFCLLSYENPEVQQNFIKKNLGTSSDFIAVLGLAQKCQFEMAKYKLAKICNINLQKGTYNFYGDEYSLFTKHLNVFLRHTTESKCYSFFVQKRNCKKRFKSYPSFDCKSQHDLIEKIKQWLEGGWASNCRKPIEDGVVSENDAHWEFCGKI